MEILSPQHWKDYELIDCGNDEKLERFGQYITIRPEPQAVWKRALPYSKWEQMAHVKFVPDSSSQGTWKKLKTMPDQWKISYDHLGFKLRLGLTKFKHVGVFPEQAANWDYIYDSIKKMNTPQPKVLNMFAYTGGASLAAKAAGADVIHLDAIKQVVSWGKENMEISGLKDIRWMVEDALYYSKKVAKKGIKYNGIILDPPAFGHGPNGESWKLERDIDELLSCVFEMLDPKEHFFIINTYSLGFSSLILRNLLQSYKQLDEHCQIGEIVLPSSQNQMLPLGVFARAFRQDK